MEKRSKDDVNIAVLANDISYIKNDVAEIKAQINHNFISREEFEPVKRLVYGLVSLILISVVGAILTLVLRK